jgi:hypothetical protein
MSEIGQTIIDAVRKAAANNPSFVYSNPALSGMSGSFCVYVRDGKPSCIIGHALWDLGFIDSTFEKNCLNTVGVDDVLSSLPALLDESMLDPNEIQWLSHAQAGQDAEKPWADAVEWADSYREEMLQTW